MFNEAMRLKKSDYYLYVCCFQFLKINEPLGKELADHY